MALRPAKCIRDCDKVAWTRHSKCKPRRSYIKTMPHKELNQHRMGTEKAEYDAVYHLTTKGVILIRDNAIEAARQSANKVLETQLPGAYYFIVRVYPHHIIRENKMVSGAGADRIQKGMRKAFGKPVDRAARMLRNQPLFTVHVHKGKQSETAVREAFRRARMKLSGSYSMLSG